MKIQHLAYTASICITIICAGALGICETLAVPEGSPFAPRQHQTPAQDGVAPVSISKGTVLILLIVGVVGVLSVRRKKNATNRAAHTAAPQIPPAVRDKVFIDLNKQYLNLQYKITQHKFSGDPPPDNLLREISDIERKVRLISRALE